MVQSPPRNIVVVGGGIAGTTTAYFLAQSAARAGAKITLVEGTKVAAGASGYSGGFLAKDWHGSATASKHTLAYVICQELNFRCISYEL